MSALLTALLSFAPPATSPEDELEDNPEWDEPDEEEDESGAVIAPAPAPTLAPSPSPTVAPAPSPQTPQTQRPGVKRGVSHGAQTGGEGGSTPAPAKSPAGTPAKSAEPDWDGKPRAEEDGKAAAEEEKKKGRFGGMKLFRFAVYPKIGYTHGTSDKDGIFDRQKSIDASIENMEATMTGAGDLGKSQFGGPMWGFEVDVEVFFVNAWLDFHKFFRPGGMWSLLIGYDHEFRLHDRVRFNLGAGFGMMRIFLGKALEDLYYDAENPEAVNIATAGIEGRLMAGFDFKIAGPLYTGPQFMGGYHYLWSANAEEVTKEKGFHYSAAWNLKLQFEFPRDW
jgi:hypothetical protein